MDFQIKTAFIAVALCLSALPASANQPIERLVAKLQGTWNEVMRAHPTCDDKKYLHVFSLSADRLILSRRYLAPFEGNFGTISEERYRILYGDEESVVLFKEGETFEHRDTGDKVVRQLLLESPNTYAWRVYGMPREHRAAAGGLRCSQ